MDDPDRDVSARQRWRWAIGSNTAQVKRWQRVSAAFVPFEKPDRILAPGLRADAGEH